MPKNNFFLSDTMMIAESYGGKCLSKEYINCEIPMLWELAKELACAKNGWCIFENYVNINSPLLWKCENSHWFLLSLSNVKNGKNWCHECIKLGLEFAQNLANKRGGTCLSSSYHNRRTLLSWKCSKGHSWFARIDSIQRGTWCPHCVGKSEKLDIEYTKELARSRNGECLSDNKNYWCPYCASTKLDISVAKAIAYSRGEKCLTDSYTNCKSQLLWRCNKNHQ
ncbi:506_t:CDS:2 [Racocetra persica]|uniref:506_t:CDS:1 n=1 Tax=Racocetra persica TaxID=160502 RepID=A0ACA9RHF6_9GLOM|nr:506_t:CDS:2 [Racocetra persica]